MTYLRKILKKVGLIPVLELHPFGNSYLIELILIKLWVQLNPEIDEPREELLVINKKYYLKTKSGVEIRYMKIDDFSNMTISKEIIKTYENKEAQLIILLIYEFLQNLLFPKLIQPENLDFVHLHPDFQRFHPDKNLVKEPSYYQLSA